MERKIFRRTSECIDSIERVYDKFYTNNEAITKEEKEKTDDYVILREPMARLAEVLYTEWEVGAVDLAKHIAIMNGDHYIDGEINVKYVK